MALVAAALALASWSKDIQQEPLRVLVSNHAGVPEVTLRKAMLTAQAIFEKAGVETEWMLPAADGGTGNPDLTVIVTPVPKGDLWEPSAFGLALQSDTHHRTGSIAYVFYRRVEEAGCRTGSVAGFRNFPKMLCSGSTAVGQFLGNVMAHESAHLLGLGHNTGGMMSARWDLEAAAARSLPFRDSEAQRLRDAVAERLAARNLLVLSRESSVARPN